MKVLGKVSVCPDYIYVHGVDSISVGAVRLSGWLQVHDENVIVAAVK